MLADYSANDEEGAEWFRRSLTELDEVLVANGLPTHHEPPSFEVPLFQLQRACASFPYSFLHYLRRAFAHVREGLAVPEDDALRPEHDRVVEDASTMFDSHLLCHSDAEGYYVPIDFPEPIFEDALPGGMLGSSQALLRELVEVAPALGLRLGPDAQPTLECEAELRAIADSGPLWRERLVWYALFEAATLSVRYGTLIVFH